MFPHRMHLDKCLLKQLKHFLDVFQTFQIDWYADDAENAVSAGNQSSTQSPVQR